MRDNGTYLIKSDGQVIFGTKQRPTDGKLLVIIPQFDISEHDESLREKYLKGINQTARLRHKNGHEEGMEKALGANANSRVMLIGDDTIIPLDQEIATKLLKQGLPLLPLARSVAISGAVTVSESVTV